MRGMQLKKLGALQIEIRKNKINLEISKITKFCLDFKRYPIADEKKKPGKTRKRVWSSFISNCPHAFCWPLKFAIGLTTH